MDSPFLYNKYVTGQRFIGRKEECTILTNLLSQSENVVIWEPYGTGKKSIVHQVLTKMRVSAGVISVSRGKRASRLNPRPFRAKGIS